MTMANAPLGDGTADDIDVIWVRREAEYFCKGGLDRANQIDPAEEFSLFAQRQGAPKLRKKLPDGHISLVRRKDCFVAFAFAPGNDEKRTSACAQSVSLDRLYRKSQWLAPCMRVCVPVSLMSGPNPSAVVKASLHTSNNPSS